MSLTILAQKCLEKKIFTKVQFFEKMDFETCVDYILDEYLITSACKLAYKKYYDVIKNDPLYLFRKQTNGNDQFFINLFKNNGIDPQEFADAFIKWVTKNDKRKNTLFLYGDLKTGKTLLASMIKDLYLYKTWINSTVSTFSLGTLAYTNIIIAEEPFFTPLVLEDFKSICCGATLTPDVKFEAPTPIERTPVLITTNFLNLARGHAPPLSEEAIKDRSWIFKLNSKLSTEYTITSNDFIAFIQKQCPDIIHTRIINHMEIKVQKEARPRKRMKKQK